MKRFDENKLRELLSYYEVGGPSPELVARTKCMVRRELLQAVPEAAGQEKWVFILVGLAVAMSLCLFYMLTVGTLLRFVLPSSLLEFLRHTLYALTAAGGSLLACTLMMLVLKYVSDRRAEGKLHGLQM